MTTLVESVRRKRTRSLDKQLDFFLRDRNVIQTELVTDLSCDGLIEPLGSSFRDGFRLSLKKSGSQARIRFTLAHEACHTFFYELVPEMKFAPHGRNDEEERLCNVGAAALLIPISSLRRKAKELPVCIESLDSLASKYTVSLPTMALRLRALGYWNCQLSLWHRMVDGSFALHKVYGGKRRSWRWDDESVLKTVWQSDEPLFGHTLIYYEDTGGAKRYKPISYEVRRWADGVIALWGTGVRKPSGEYLPLFGASLRLPQS